MQNYYKRDSAGMNKSRGISTVVNQNTCPIIKLMHFICKQFKINQYMYNLQTFTDVKIFQSYDPLRTAPMPNNDFPARKPNSTL